MESIVEIVTQENVMHGDQDSFDSIYKLYTFWFSTFLCLHKCLHFLHQILYL